MLSDWCPLSAAAAAPPASPSCRFLGSQVLLPGPNSLCGSVIVAGCQHEGAMLDLLEEGIQYVNVWERRALGKEIGIV